MQCKIRSLLKKRRQKRIQHGGPVVQMQFLYKQVGPGGGGNTVLQYLLQLFYMT